MSTQNTLTEQNREHVQSKVWTIFSFSISLEMPVSARKMNGYTLVYVRIEECTLHWQFGISLASTTKTKKKIFWKSWPFLFHGIKWSRSFKHERKVYTKYRHNEEQKCYFNLFDSENAFANHALWFRISHFAFRSLCSTHCSVSFVVHGKIELCTYKVNNCSWINKKCVYRQTVK